jgi:hypothetical protein
METTAAEIASPFEGNPIKALSDDFHEYDPHQPLGSYLVLTGVFGLAFLSLCAADRGRERVSPIEDAVLSAIGIHKLSRIVTRDRVLAPFRAPFTKFEKSAGAGEVEEESRGAGLRNAIGRLVTCPYCVAPWIAVCVKGMFRVAPNSTRLLMEVLALVTASDFLNRLYAKLEDT